MSDRNSDFNRSVQERPEGARGASSVESLASEALKKVAQRRLTGNASLEERFVKQLHSAVTHPDSSRREAVVADMLEARLSKDDIAERIIPEVARRLGQEWCEDQSSFAMVTIGVARLQAMLRDLTPRHNDNISKRSPGTSVAVIATEDHTLGAMVLARIVRRLGASVRLIVGKSDSEAIACINAGSYDGVMISAACVDRLPRVKSLVDKLKRANTADIPVIVGGFAVQSIRDPKKATGADFVESDPEKALALCGMKTRQPDGGQRATLE